MRLDAPRTNLRRFAPSTPEEAARVLARITARQVLQKTPPSLAWAHTPARFDVDEFHDGWGVVDGARVDAQRFPRRWLAVRRAWEMAASGQAEEAA